MKTTTLFSLVLAVMFVAVSAHAQSGRCDPTDIPKTVDGLCHFSKKCQMSICRVTEGQPFPADLETFDKVLVVVEGGDEGSTIPAPAPIPTPVRTPAAWHKAFSFGPILSVWETAGDYSLGGGGQLEWYATKHLLLQARGLIGTSGGKTRTNFGLGTSLGPALQLDCGLRFGLRGELLYYPETDHAVKERATERYIGTAAFIGYHNPVVTRGLVVELSAGAGARYREMPGYIKTSPTQMVGLTIGWLF